MSDSQSGHVWPNLIPQQLSPRIRHIRSLIRVLERLVGHVWPSTWICSASQQNFKLDQKSSFLIYLFYPSWSMWSCEDFAMLKRGSRFWLRKLLSWIIYICDLELSYCELWEEGQAIKVSSCKSRSLSSQIPNGRSCPKCLKER
jgi:hypothetical protein